MTQIPATSKKPTLPSMTILLDALKREIIQEMNCVKIGVIQSFNPTLQEAVILIAYQQITSVAANGTQTIAQFPLLLNVPVQFPSGGGFTLTFPVTAGDECIVLFNDKQIDNWLVTGQIVPPSIGRVHDLSDGIAIVGIRNNMRALANFSTTSTQMRSDDGATYIDMAAGKIQIVADEVVIHGNVKATFDADGTGFVYTAALISTYTDGVATTHSVPTPPEVPT